MKELKRQMKEKTFCPCYLFYGSEGYLKKTYAAKMKATMIEESAELMNFDCFEDKKIAISTLLDTAETMPFLSEKRLVMVKNSGLFRTGRKEDSEKMADYLANIPESTCILFIEEEIDKRGRLYKAVGKNGYVVEFKPLSEKDLMVWIGRECKKNNLKMDGATASYLIRTVGGDMENLVREMAKLGAFAGEGGSVSNQDVDEICIKSLETKIFDLVGALGGGKTKEAVTIYRNLLMMKESPLMVLSMLSRQFRIILQCKTLLEAGETQSGIGHRTGLRDFVVRESLRQGKNFSIKRLKEGLDDCLQTDVNIKTGRMQGELAVEVLIIKYGGR